MKKRGLWSATFTFVGVVVGAGVLGLPYMLSKYGFLTGLLTMLLTLLILIPSSLAIGELVQRTKGKHQIPGLAEKYLGKKGKTILMFFVALGIYAALIAYCIGAGSTLSSIFGINALYLSIIFWIVLSFVVFFKLQVLAKAESILNPLKILILIIIGLFVLTKIQIANLSSFNIYSTFAPLGVVLFAFMGINVIPTLNHELQDKKLLKKAILYGFLISAVVYIIFATALVGVMGLNTPEVATVGLSNLGSTAMILINLFATLALATAFIGLAYALKESFVFDLKLKKNLSWFLVIIVPLFFIFLQPASFIQILGISGTVGAGLEIIILLFAHSKAQKKSEKKPTFTIHLPWFLKFVIISLLLYATYQEFIIFFI